MKRTMTVLAMVLLGVGCGAGQKQSLAAVQQYLKGKFQDLETESAAVCAAAPPARTSGWNATSDKNAIDSMKAAWKRARVPQDQLSGVIAALNPNTFASTETTYDVFIAGAADDNLFDDEGFTGSHAIERILWSGNTSSNVTTAESEVLDPALDGGSNYVAAHFPQNQAEANDFKSKLCPLWASQLKGLNSDFTSKAFDPGVVLRGAADQISFHATKLESVNTWLDESRYAQYSLQNMRDNVAGAQSIYLAFEPWVLESDGAEDNKQIKLGLTRLEKAYDDLPGDQLPLAPATWVTELTPDGFYPEQSEADANSPYGVMFQTVAVDGDGDITVQNSPASGMQRAADLLGFKRPDVPDAGQ